MMPIGPLMIEHRLIERMIRLLKQQLEKVGRQKKPDPVFIDVAVDFIKNYADRCHHGKEEDILFRDLAKKGLSDEHKGIMGGLLEEHARARKATKSLLDAKERYLTGNADALSDIVDAITWLVNFYPTHIEKEDRQFFMPVMGYFTKQEQDAMLQEFYEFDRNLVHATYRGIIERMERT
ncbi:MAG: hemerythrin domain-containing protein [Syntrophorhabdales bacterium]